MDIKFDSWYSSITRKEGGYVALLTVTDAAAMLGITTRSLYYWEATGRVASLRTPGGHRRYRTEDLEVLLTEHRVIPKKKDMVTLDRFSATVAEALGDKTIPLDAPVLIRIRVGRLNHEVPVRLVKCLDGGGKPPRVLLIGEGAADEEQG